MAGILETLVEWLVSVSRWFDGWDITILVPALIILTVIAGVTGRADATRLGNGDRDHRSDRSRHHLDHHRPLPAGRGHGHAHPEHATTQAAARYRVSGGTVPLEEAVGLEELGVKVPTLTLTME